MKTFRTLLFALAFSIPALAIPALAVAAQPPGFWSYPAIQGFGPVHVWPQATVRPNKDTTYKALFDVTKSKALDKLNGSLDHTARTVNAFASVGVPLKHLKFVVIIHGPATPIVLSEKAFEAKFGHPNPDLKIISALHKAGVEILVCGNALADQGYNPSDVNPQVKIALSAVSTLVALQNKGYALMRM